MAFSDGGALSSAPPVIGSRWTETRNWISSAHSGLGSSPLNSCASEGASTCSGVPEARSSRKNLRGLRRRGSQKPLLLFLRARSIKGNDGTGCAVRSHETREQEGEGTDFQNSQRSCGCKYLVRPVQSAELVNRGLPRPGKFSHSRR